METYKSCSAKCPECNIIVYIFPEMIDEGDIYCDYCGIRHG